MSTLKGLSGEVRRLVLDPNFRSGVQETIDATQYLVDNIGLGREVSLAPLEAVIEEAMRRFPPKKSDPWLAPRVHATLRLTRREAADKRIWNYLTIVQFPRYVRWRYRNAEDPESIVPLERFFGEDSANALARLWWAAELTRNGADYAPTEKALSNSQFARSWQKLDLMHHRATALAVVDFLDHFAGQGVTDYQGQVMAKAFNLALRTLALDSLWKNPAPDFETVYEWCREPIDETKMMNDLPLGPDEGTMPPQAIAAVREVLDRLAKSIELSTLKLTRRGTADEGDEAEMPASASAS